MILKEHKRALAFLGLLAALLLVAGCLFAWYEHTGQGNTKTTGMKQSGTVEEQAEAIVAAMTPEQRVGQLMMVGIQGTSVDQDAAYQIAQYHMGNIILFDRNMQSTQQVKDLNRTLTRQIRKESGGVAPFIAVDQEGGFVMRMREAFPRIPSEQQLGESGDPAAAKEWAKKIGKQLKDMGFSMNFAPVVDLGSASERSYSKDPAVVTAFAAEAIAGYEEEKIWCSLKHFPGIGRVKTDPHIDGDVVTASKEELRADPYGVATAHVHHGLQCHLPGLRSQPAGLCFRTGHDGHSAAAVWLSGADHFRRYGNGRHGQALCLCRYGRHGYQGRRRSGARVP